MYLSYNINLSKQTGSYITLYSFEKQPHCQCLSSSLSPPPPPPLVSPMKKHNKVKILCPSSAPKSSSSSCFSWLCRRRGAR